MDNDTVDMDSMNHMHNTKKCMLSVHKHNTPTMNKCKKKIRRRKKEKGREINNGRLDFFVNALMMSHQAFQDTTVR